MERKPAGPEGHHINAHTSASTVRREDARLLSGRGRYIADIVVPGSLEAAFVRSPVAHGEIRSIDTTAALELDGVAAVLTGESLPDHSPLVDAVAIDGLAKTPQPPLASGRVRFVGEAVAIVLAADRYVAEDAAALVDVDYEMLPAVTDAVRAAEPDAPVLFEELATNVVYRGTKTFGDPDDAMAGAHRVYRSEFRGGRLTAAPMEPRGCIAEYEPARGRLTVWASTQGEHLLRRRLATTIGLPENRIRVVAPDVGGGFGQKIPAAPEEIAVALAAMAVGRPVRWIEDRRENLVAGPQAKEQLVTTEIGIDRDGTFVAMRSRVVGDAGAFSFNSASALVEPYLSALLMPSVYRIPHFECEIVAALTNKAPVSPYRGVGWTASHSARELLIDRIARAEGMDPADLRRRNMVETGEFPYTNVVGMVFDSGSFRESLDTALDLAGYAELRAPGATETGPVRRGVGISPYVEPNGWGSRGAEQSHWVFASHDVARVSMDSTGHVTVAVGTPSQGQGHETMLSDLAARTLGVPADTIEIHSGDTDVTPPSIAGTRASRTAVVTGGAVVLAAQDVRAKLVRIASQLLEAAEQDIVVEDGSAHIVGDESAAVSVARIAAAAYFDPAVRGAEPEPFLSSQRFHDPDATYSNGCMVAVVDVDTGTGGVEVVDLVAVEDCGRMINPMIVEGQLRGAAVQGVGAALLEAVEYDEDGQILTATLMDYLLPTAADSARIRIGHLESPSPHTVGGVKGMGESGMIAIPAAIANAVADALPGHPDIDHLPITPSEVAALAAGSPGGERP